MHLKNDKGVALAVTLLVMMVLLTLGSIFVFRCVQEKKLADQERRLTQAFYVSDGGSQSALSQLDTLINTNLLNTLNIMNPQTVATKAASYVTSGDGVGFLIEFVKNGGTALLTLTGGQAIYNSATISLGSGSYQFQLTISEKSNPTTVSSDKWDFPYYYKVQTTGTIGTVVRKVALTGDFTVRVQRDNFARYALFTDHHTMQNGTTVWFTNKTNFAGPIHTNEQFSFALNPSGVFDGVVTQQNSNARFYNNGSPFQANQNTNPGIDVPTFNSTYTRGVTSISLATSVQKQDLINQARSGDTTSGNGIFLANSGSSLTGGIYVNGDASVNMSVDASDNAVYTIAQAGTIKTITVNGASNQTTVQTGASTVTYAGKPDGTDGLGTLIYVNGAVTNLQGTVQKDTQLTISTENDIVVGNHVRYSEYNAAVGTPGTAGYVPPNADDKTNLLGLVSWSGNVRLGTTAPNNVDVHAITMARNGVFSVDNYNDSSVGPRGTATLLGGAITSYYGAFGLFNGSTGAAISGFGRNFVYDGRTSLGQSPPYFPSMQTFVGFTNDITDKIAWQEGGF